MLHAVSRVQVEMDDRFGDYNECNPSKSAPHNFDCEHYSDGYCWSESFVVLGLCVAPIDVYVARMPSQATSIQFNVDNGAKNHFHWQWEQPTSFVGCDGKSCCKDCHFI